MVPRVPLRRAGVGWRPYRLRRRVVWLEPVRGAPDATRLLRRRARPAPFLDDTRPRDRRVSAAGASGGAPPTGINSKRAVGAGTAEPWTVPGTIRYTGQRST